MQDSRQLKNCNVHNFPRDTIVIDDTECMKVQQKSHITIITNVPEKLSQKEVLLINIDTSLTTTKQKLCSLSHFLSMKLRFLGLSVFHSCERSNC